MLDLHLLSPAFAAALVGAAVALRPPEARQEEMPPLRAEIFSHDRLVEHARALAGEQPVAAEPRRGQPLLRHVDESARVLLQVYRDLAAAARRQEPISV